MSERYPFLIPTKRATVIKIWTQPRASKTRILGLHEGQLKIAVCAPPVDGAANSAIQNFLAEILSLAKTSIILQSGQTSRKKRFLIACSLQWIEDRLTSFLVEPSTMPREIVE